MTLRLFRCSCNPSQLRLPRTSSAQLSKLKVIINSSPTHHQLITNFYQATSTSRSVPIFAQSKPAETQVIDLLTSFPIRLQEPPKNSSKKPTSRSDYILITCPGRVKPVIFNCKLYELEVRTFDTNSFDAVFDHFGGHSGAHYAEHLKLPFETAFQNRPYALQR